MIPASKQISIGMCMVYDIVLLVDLYKYVNQQKENHRVSAIFSSCEYSVDLESRKYIGTHLICTLATKNCNYVILIFHVPE